MTEAQKESISLPARILIRHIGRGPEARIERRLRPGNRSGFVLGDGTRVRMARTREIDTRSLLEHLEQLVDGVQKSYIELQVNGQPVPLATLDRWLVAKNDGLFSPIFDKSAKDAGPTSAEVDRFIDPGEDGKSAASSAEPEKTRVNSEAEASQQAKAAPSGPAKVKKGR